MKRLYFIQSQVALSSSFMNFISVVCSVVFLLSPVVASAQVGFFREYSPTAANASDIGKCIIRLSNVDDQFLTVGQISAPNVPFAAHGLWTQIGGGVNASTFYNRVPYNDYLGYTLNRVAETTVEGSYDAVAPYTTYIGHPATGYKVFEIGDPIGLQPATWTTIIDPATHNTVWDHIITNNNGDISVGVGVVIDRNNPNDFFVLSQLSGSPGSRFAVTKYVWTGGGYGHQVAWSKEYSLDDYNLTPVGIVQFWYGHLVVAGNAVPIAGGDSRVFTQFIYTATGNPVANLNIYDLTDPDHSGLPWTGDIIANSITAVYDPVYKDYYHQDLLIAGKAKQWWINRHEHIVWNPFPPPGHWDTYYTYDTVNTERPFLLSFNSFMNPKMEVYEFKRNVNDSQVLRGEFKYAKEEYRRFAQVGSPVKWTATAVGRLGDSLTYPSVSDPLITNLQTLDDAFLLPNCWWAVLHREDFTPRTSPTASVADWYTTIADDGDETLGNFIYTGEQSGGAVTHTIGGAVGKVAGETECSESVVITRLVEPEVTPAGYTPNYEDWGDDEEQRTATDDVELSPLKCNTVNDENEISAGKHSFPTKGRTDSMKDNAQIIVLEDAINIQYSASEDGTAKLMVVNLLGIPIVNQQIFCSAGTHYYTISTKEWTTGYYSVAVVSPNARFNKNVVILK
jgi:hypothetical protein